LFKKGFSFGIAKDVMFPLIVSYFGGVCASWAGTSLVEGKLFLCVLFVVLSIINLSLSVFFLVSLVARVSRITREETTEEVVSFFGKFMDEEDLYFCRLKEKEEGTCQKREQGSLSLGEN
jgi:hypothetical protein